MTGKVLGLVLLILGMAGGLILWCLSKPSSRTVRTQNELRRYPLLHEYSKKGFTEKGQSEGIQDIPRSSSPKHDESIESDSFFNSTLPDNKNAPGDNF